MTSKGKIIGIVAALGILAVVMAQLAGFFGAKVAPGRIDVAPESIRGEVFTVTASQVPVIEQATGSVRSRVETLLSARITARVIEVPVSAGDSVAAGDVLLTLDDRDLRSRLQQLEQAVVSAQANLAEAEPRYARAKSLFAQNAASKAEVESAEARLRSARAELARSRRAVEEAETALSYSVIRASAPARVVDRLVDPGDTATPGQPLLRLYDPGQLRLEANVRESLATLLARDQSLVARIDALNAEYPVTIEEIVPSADPGSRSFIVKASLPDDAKLYPGMFGRLLIVHGSDERYYVPERAVERVGQLEFVNVIGDKGVQRRFVRTGEKVQGGRLEVVSGLRPGERIVVSP
ncbi:MAG: efflux RND transporter periplasmic adaptor subunit [Gammaproteobacteria bacterium]|nr:MAG: efflux RND transporter periplasmic adaptor subunit [Gammaproteobacteria bacterium]